eukprot:6177459-Pleurochrysis_carterae.AAC.1
MNEFFPSKPGRRPPPPLFSRAFCRATLALLLVMRAARLSLRFCWASDCTRTHTRETHPMDWEVQLSKKAYARADASTRTHARARRRASTRGTCTHANVHRQTHRSTRHASAGCGYARRCRSLGVSKMHACARALSAHAQADSAHRYRCNWT